MSPPTGGDIYSQGAFRDLCRHAEMDGLRVMAAIARYIEPGDDPVRFILKALADLDIDVDANPDWLREGTVENTCWTPGD